MTGLRFAATMAVISAMAFSAPALMGGEAAAQQPVTLKMASFPPAASATSRMFNRYIEEFKQKSGGRLLLEVYHGATMGPLPRHYDLARTGVADLSFFQHGATPGRFPLTELTHMPYVFPDGVKGSKVATQVAQDMIPEFLGKEHDDTHLLWIVYNRPSAVYETSRVVTKIDDLKGRRYRAPTNAVTEMLKSIGAVPVGVPATAMAESLQKGTIDGIITDPIGVFSFRLGSLVKHHTPMMTSVISFGMTMNKQRYESLPADLRAIVDSLRGAAAAVDMTLTTWDDFPEFTKYMQESNIKDAKLDQKSDDELRRLAEQYITKHVAEMEAKGLPANKAYGKLKELSAKYAAMN